MKSLPYFLIFILLVGCTGKSGSSSDSTQPSQPKRATTTIEWLTGTTHDFGVYKERETKTFSFVFRNTGTIPFAIDSVKTSCGCTSAQYAKKPVLPGKTDTIHVSYHGNGFVPGYFRQLCAVFGNVDEVPIALEIKGIFDHVE